MFVNSYGPPVSRAKNTRKLAFQIFNLLVAKQDISTSKNSFERKIMMMISLPGLSN